MISDELARVLRDWRDDATSDDPSFLVKHCGLCHFVRSESTEAYCDLKDCLLADFDECSLPFDTRYSYEHDTAKHLNPRRRAWVDEKLREYDESV